MPFAPALMSANPLSRVCEMFYASTLLLAALVQRWLFGRALQPGYLQPDVGPVDVASALGRAWGLPVAAAMSLVLAWFHPALNNVVLLTIPLLTRLFARSPSTKTLPRIPHLMNTPSTSTPHPRRWHSTLPAGAAVLGWAALALQLWLSIQLTTSDGRSAWQAAWIYLGYFTILTNVLAAATLSAMAWPSMHAASRWLRRPNVLGATATSIIVVSAVYNLLLRQLWQPQGWQWVGDITLHDVMPVLYVACWWLLAPKASLHATNLLRWMAWPAAYFAYAMARGALDGWYPYPFLDVTALGYPRVLLDACGMLLAFLAIGAVLLALGRWQARHSSGG